MVGSRFCELQKTYELIKTDLSGNINLDITKKEDVKSFFKNYSFSWLILFAAFTDVDGAEIQKGDKNGLAWKINVEGTKNIVSECASNKIRLIYLSTEFVFSGENGPYNETSPRESNINKISWYGFTKLKGEEIVEKALKDSIILRITYPYRSKFADKLDFARSILKNYDAGTLHPMFSDQKITPTFVDDITPAIELLIEKDQRGIFHLASPDIVTPFEFASYLLEKFGRNIKLLKKSSIKDYLRNNDKAPRPINGGLSTNKIAKLGLNPTTWKDGIDAIYQQSSGKLL